jgi:hypothetical protein
MCQEPVPAESTVNLSCGSLEAKIPSANGERQILPKQTIRIFTDMMAYNVSFLLMSSTNFLNCLSVATKLSTVLQACNTVA